MREIRTSGSMSGVEETGLWKTSVSGWGESLPAQSAPTFLQVPRLPPTLALGGTRVSAKPTFAEICVRCLARTPTCHRARALEAEDRLRRCCVLTFHGITDSRRGEISPAPGHPSASRSPVKSCTGQPGWLACCAGQPTPSGETKEPCPLGSPTGGDISTAMTVSI
jgi:hypothetical protein